MSEKNFLLFSGDDYYPRGGWCDYQGSFESVEAAVIAARMLNDSWWHVIDVRTKAAVQHCPFYRPPKPFVSP